MHNNILTALMSLFFLSAAYGAGSDKFHKNIMPGFGDQICDSKKGRFLLVYDPGKRIIRLRAVDLKSDAIVAKLERNAGPELVGAGGSVRFISRNVVSVGGRSFVPLTYAERSMRGDGGGQCGGGAEVYLVVYELIGKKLLLRSKNTIESCNSGMDLSSMDVADGGVRIDWLSYPPDAVGAWGMLDFLSGQLVVGFKK